MQEKSGRQTTQKTVQKNRRRTGAAYEQAAGFYLEQLGYEILQYNEAFGRTRRKDQRGKISIGRGDGESSRGGGCKKTADHFQKCALLSVGARLGRCPLPV